MSRSDVDLIKTMKKTVKPIKVMKPMKLRPHDVPERRSMWVVAADSIIDWHLERARHASR